MKSDMKLIEKIDLIDTSIKKQFDVKIKSLLSQKARIDLSQERIELGFTSNRYDIIEEKADFIILEKKISQSFAKHLVIKELMIHNIKSGTNEKINWHCDRDHCLDPMHIFGTIVYYPLFNSQELILVKGHGNVLELEPGDCVFIHPDLIHSVPENINRMSDRISMAVRLYPV